MPRRSRKWARAGDGAGQQAKLRASRPGEIWAIDFQADQTADGRALRLVNVVDEFTRQALVMHVARSISADHLVQRLDRLAAQHGAPAFVRCDNGRELTGHALRDWCRQSGAKTAFIEPGAPWQNPFVESFHARVRDELLNVELFSCLAEARVVIEDWARGLQQPPSALRARAQDPGRVRRHLDPYRHEPRGWMRTPLGSPSGLASRRAHLSAQLPTVFNSYNHLTLTSDGPRTGSGHLVADVVMAVCCAEAAVVA